MLQRRVWSVDEHVTVLPVPPQTEMRRGIIRFIGETHFAPGPWVGVELIGSTGRNNGSVQGKSYFHCAPGQGVFVRPELLVPFAEVHTAPLPPSTPPQTAADLTPGAKSGRNSASHDIPTTTTATTTTVASAEAPMTGDAASNSVQLMNKLQADIAHLHEALQRKDTALREATKALRQRDATAPISPSEDTHLDETEQLRRAVADLREMCELQAEELHQQRSHGDALTQLVEDMQRQHHRELEELHDDIRELESKLHAAEEEMAIRASPPNPPGDPHTTSTSSSSQTTRKVTSPTWTPRAEEDAAARRLEVFQQAQERAALRQLTERYDALHAACEAERAAYAERTKESTADYEEALARQQNYKERLAEEAQQLRQQLAEAKASCERVKAMRVGMSATERVGYERMLRNARCELMELTGKSLARRYNTEEMKVPLHQWPSPVAAIAATTEALLAIKPLLSFTTPEMCRTSRMELFHPIAPRHWSS